MALITCPICGGQALNLGRGRRRRYCSDQCRHEAHARRRRAAGATIRRRPEAMAASTPDAPLTPPAGTGTWEAWATWLQATYELDETALRLMHLVVEAGARYEQARVMLDRDGLVLDGRAHPALAAEREARAAIARLIGQLDLEDSSHDDAQATPDGQRYPRPA